MGMDISEQKLVIAAEGGRGVGKTTIVRQVVEQLVSEGNVVAVNRGEADSLPIGVRRIIEGKSQSPTHQEAIRIHNAWRRSFSTDGDELIPEDPDRSFELSYNKFLLGLEELVKEYPNIQDARSKTDIVILDRDLDTVVAYGEAELFLSDPERFESSASRKEFIRLLWEITANRLGLIGRTPADITIYFETMLPEETLERGHGSKVNTGSEYEMDIFQIKSQELIGELYEMTLAVHKEIFPDHRVHSLAVDGKSPEEISKMVRILMRKDPERMIKDVAPIELPGNVVPDSIEELIDLLGSYSAGSTFPARWEVAEYGASNCVYSNASLKLYADFYGLGELHFTEVSHSRDIDSSPVHWCLLQIDRDNNRCRAIDITPFNEPYIGEWEVLRESEANRYELEDPKYSLLTIDSIDNAAEYMEFANLVETSSDLDHIGVVADSLIENADNESKYIFAVVRYSRALIKGGESDRAVELLQKASTEYPNNLILLRELAKLVNSGDLTHISLEDRFREAWSRILRSVTANPQKHQDYYVDIKIAANIS